MITLRANLAATPQIYQFKGTLEDEWSEFYPLPETCKSCDADLAWKEDELEAPKISVLLATCSFCGHLWMSWFEEGVPFICGYEPDEEVVH